MSVYARIIRAAIVLWTSSLAGRSASRLRGPVSSGFFNYDYSHLGNDWTMGVCASRNRQSPIDFSANQQTESGGQVTYKYFPVTSAFDLLNTGRTFSADLTNLAMGGVTYGGAWYNLLNINVHAQSEHTWAGAHEQLELHLVHKRSDSDAILIVAVPVHGTVASSSAAPAAAPATALLAKGADQAEEYDADQAEEPAAAPVAAPPAATAYTPPAASDPNFNAALQAFLMQALPTTPDGKVRVIPDNWDLNTFLEGEFYEYAGSFSAPPCAENAVWLVRTQPIAGSDAQVTLLSQGVVAINSGSFNYRQTMPLNGREIRLFSTSKEPEIQPAAAAAAAPAAAPAAGGAPAVPTRESNAIATANQALNIAEAAKNAVKPPPAAPAPAGGGTPTSSAASGATNFVAQPKAAPASVQQPTRTDAAAQATATAANALEDGTIALNDEAAGRAVDQVEQDAEAQEEQAEGGEQGDHDRRSQETEEETARNDDDDSEMEASADNTKESEDSEDDTDNGNEDRLEADLASKGDNTEDQEDKA